MTDPIPPMTGWQRGQIARQAQRLGLTAAATDAYCHERFGTGLSQLSRDQARQLADDLGQRTTPPPPPDRTEEDAAATFTAEERAAIRALAEKELAARFFEETAYAPAETVRQAMEREAETIATVEAIPTAVLKRLAGEP